MGCPGSHQKLAQDAHSSSLPWPILMPFLCSAGHLQVQGAFRRPWDALGATKSWSKMHPSSVSLANIYAFSVPPVRFLQHVQPMSHPLRTCGLLLRLFLQKNVNLRQFVDYAFHYASHFQIVCRGSDHPGRVLQSLKCTKLHKVKFLGLQSPVSSWPRRGREA